MRESNKEGAKGKPEKEKPIKVSATEKKWQKKEYCYYPSW